MRRQAGVEFSGTCMMYDSMQALVRISKTLQGKQINLCAPNLSLAGHMAFSQYHLKGLCRLTNRISLANVEFWAKPRCPPLYIHPGATYTCRDQLLRWDKYLSTHEYLFIINCKFASTTYIWLLNVNMNLKFII